MEPITCHTGIAAPLRAGNVDTDQIIPAVYLKRITKTGFDDALFAGWRKDPDFVLNQPAYRQGSILVVGPDFGTGSSREHAVWALQNYGFKVVIGSRFGDIFRGNSGKSGLLLATITPDQVAQLWDFAEARPGEQITVDLVNRTITAGEFSIGFEIDDYTRHRLLEGLDDIAISLRHADSIDAYEAKRPSFKPTTPEAA